MAIKVCKACGKSFDGSGTSAYCPGPHIKTCAVCGREFEYDPRTNPECCSRTCSAALRLKRLSEEIRVCELCGKEFTPKIHRQKYCEGPHYRPCPICGKPVEYTDPFTEPKCCSKECSTARRKQTCLSIYGTEVASQSEAVRAKLHDKACSDEVRIHKEATCLDRWGVKNAAQAESVRAKISATISSEECQAKMRATSRSRYGFDHAMQSVEGMKRYCESVQAKYGVPYFVMAEECKAASGHIVSKINRDFGDLLAAEGIQYKFEHRIGEYSYDIEIVGSNILIEINPTYTHNIVGNHWGPSKFGKYYHRDKTAAAVNAGYRCINVWDWDNLDQIISLVKPKQPIHARNCTISLIDAKTASEFEAKYHLQGPVTGQSICLGLYFADELVQVMTFGKPRYSSKYEWELLRLCSSSNYAVVGGANRLWMHFIRTHQPNSVISYCDQSKFTGSIYTKLGMALDHIVPPNKIWSRGSAKITHNLLLSRGYDQLFGTNYGKGTSNEQLMLGNGWLPVYDCGQAAYIYMKPEDLR